MIISIHQPNFMPWHPFFEKIQQSDLFVFLTHCQFEKGGYQNRFNYNNKWYTMSTSRGLIPIIDKTYINPHHSWNRIKEQLPDKEATLSQFDNDISDSLVETNINIIKRILNFQHLKSEIERWTVRDYKTELTSTERLVDICVMYGATTYLSGIGAKEYLNESLFEEKGINVEYQKIIDKSPILDIL